MVGLCIHSQNGLRPDALVIVPHGGKNPRVYSVQQIEQSTRRRGRKHRSDEIIEVKEGV
jgi:hypothetical protein